jgi:hypothetical protein
MIGQIVVGEFYHLQDSFRDLHGDFCFVFNFGFRNLGEQRTFRRGDILRLYRVKPQGAGVKIASFAFACAKMRYCFLD